jgi:multiple sugar transport system ATP-binding protein
MNEVRPQDRDVAMVFQNHSLYPHMTVFENVAFGLKLRKVPKAEIEQRVKAAGESLGLTRHLERFPKELSGGERQRVALARAIVRRPKVFLFDEPLSNLDATLRVQLRAEISRLHRQIEATMIYVTHDQIEAMTLGQRIAVLKNGVLQQLADPLELYRDPANMFVAGFHWFATDESLSWTSGESARRFDFPGTQSVRRGEWLAHRIAIAR